MKLPRETYAAGRITSGYIRYKSEREESQEESKRGREREGGRERVETPAIVNGRRDIRASLDETRVSWST